VVVSGRTSTVLGRTRRRPSQRPRRAKGRPWLGAENGEAAIMKKQDKTYVGAAIYFERLPDNEWLEDADAPPALECDDSKATRSTIASRESSAPHARIARGPASRGN
jgi:hypothetical protein